MLPSLNRKLTKLSGPLWVHQRRYVLLKFGNGITEMRGSLAGNVYSRNRYGAYARARTKPTNPNTARQQGIRNAIAALTVIWSTTLTAAQRAAWNLYGNSVAMKNKLGETIYLTGFNHFIRSNANLHESFSASIDDGPVIFELPAKDPMFAITISEATQEITMAFNAALPWNTEAGARFWPFQGSPQNAQRNYFNGPWRKMAHIAGVDPGGEPSPVTKPVQFAVAEGQHIWCYARIQRADGRLSEPFQADTFCTA